MLGETFLVRVMVLEYRRSVLMGVLLKDEGGGFGFVLYDCDVVYPDICLCLMG